ncbi:MAG: 3-isopropylmalate dehydrogenase [Acidobacteriia bacterium]|nr:3-isopropylmalate dehydrogenase [Terriglobia bacterium]
MKRIAVIAGDGIGIDVTREAVKVIEALKKLGGLEVDLKEFDWGAERFLRDGISMPPGGLDMLRNEFDAIFVGALGDPRIPDMRHAADILLGIRFGLDLYANVRPVKLISRKLTPLKDRTEQDIHFTVFRENTEGAYVGMGGNFKKGTADEVAIQEELHTRKGVERIIVYAFEFARKNRLKKVCMSDKSNVMRYGHDLWQRVFKEVSGRYPEIEPSHLYVDALTMQMVKNPGQFEVIVTNNMFGDIVTDLGAALQGGLGLAASGNINPEVTSMFEPVHGSAPKYAGKNIANPLGAILTSAMMLAHLGFEPEAKRIEDAVKDSIDQNVTTTDLKGKYGTREVGDFIAQHVIAAR